MVSRTQPVDPKKGPVTLAGVDGYQSAQSGSPGDYRRPPSENNVLQTPLFDRRSLERLNEMPAEAPHLYTGTGPSLQAGGVLNSGEKASSTNSSDIQLEVRRQLAEFMALHEDESLRLRQQVEMLILENRELRSRNERVPKPPTLGLDGSSFSGLGWVGRGIGFILGSIPKTGYPSQAMDFRPPKAPVPPPPPPPEITSQDLDLVNSRHHSTELHQSSPVTATAGDEIPVPPVSRRLTYESSPAVPRASAQSPPQAEANAQGSTNPALAGSTCSCPHRNGSASGRDFGTCGFT